MVREWARKLSIGYAIYALVMWVVGNVFTFIFFVRPLLDQAAQQRGPEAAGAMGGLFGAAIGALLGPIYPVLLLIFMTRPKVKAAFRGPPDPYSSPPPY
jgi:hypothetical protein